MPYYREQKPHYRSEQTKQRLCEIWAREACRKLGVPMPRIRFYSIHEDPEWYEADRKAGRLTGRLESRPRGFYQPSTPGAVWVRTDLDDRQLKMTLLHELQHYSDNVRGIPTSEARALEFTEDEELAATHRALKNAGIKDPAAWIADQDRRLAAAESYLAEARRAREPEPEWRYNEATRRYEQVTPVELSEAALRMRYEQYYRR